MGLEKQFHIQRKPQNNKMGRKIFSKILLGIVATLIINMNIMAMAPPAEAQLYTLFTYRGDTYTDTIRSDGSHLWSGGGGKGVYVDSGATDQSRSPFNGRPVYVPYLLDIQDDWVTFESGSVTWTFDIPTCSYKLFEGGRIGGKSPVIDSVSITFQEKVGQSWQNLPHNDEECKVTVNELEDDTVQLIARQGTPQIGYTEIELIQKGGYELETWYRSPYDIVGGKQYGFVESHIKNQVVTVKGNTYGNEISQDIVKGKSEFRSNIAGVDVDELIFTSNENGIVKTNLKDTVHNALTDATIKKYSPTQLQTFYDFHNTNTTGIGERLEIDPTYSSNNPTSDDHWSDTDGQGIDGDCDDTSLTYQGITKNEQGNAGLVGTVSIANTYDCTRVTVEWDVTSISDNADVTDVNVDYDVYQNSWGGASGGCDWNPIDNYQPSSIGAGSTDKLNMWDDINDGATFANSSDCNAVGDNKNIDLGTGAETNMEADLSGGQNWWAVGIKADVEPDDVENMTWICVEEQTCTPDFTLNVTYIDPCTPNAPTSPTAESSSTSQIDLTWVAPVNCTNNAVQVFESPDGSTSWSSIYNGAVKTSHSATSLSSNEDYFYKMRYKSTDELWGANSTNVSDYTTPGTVSGLTTNTISDSQIDASWSAVSGSGTVTYDVEQRNGTKFGDVCSGFTGWSIVSNDQSGLTYNSTNLDITTCYDYRISATNSDSTGATSTQTGATLPIEPRMLLGATTFSNSQINLTWLPPTEGAGSFYKVYYRTLGGAWQVLTANTTSSSPEYNATGLASNVVYDFKVATLGLGGESTNTTLVKSDTTIPGATTLTANGISLSDIFLSWTNPTGNGTITGYKIARESPIGGGWSFIVNDTGNANTNYTDSGLPPNTVFNYRLFALNEGNNDE